jgi:hypothetical protein
MIKGCLRIAMAVRWTAFRPTPGSIRVVHDTDGVTSQRPALLFRVSNLRKKASPSVNGRAIGSNSLTEEPNQSVSNLQQL